MPMKLLTAAMIVISPCMYGQTIKNVTPTLGLLVDKSAEGEAEFLRVQNQCSELWKKKQKKVALTADEERTLKEGCSEGGPENYFDIFGPECSWYCGGGADTQTASSELPTYKDINYSADNAHDLSYKTAWIEGVPGFGIGESLTYHFPPENPRITKIIIVNGYVKSQKSWRENSRVKILKMYIDNKPFALLNLEDTRHEQQFTFDPIGNGNRLDMVKLKATPSWTMTFEIVDVFKGDKYEDTAITKIYFDGIDVH